MGGRGWQHQLCLHRRGTPSGSVTYSYGMYGLQGLQNVLKNDGVMECEQLITQITPIVTITTVITMITLLTSMITILVIIMKLVIMLRVWRGAGAGGGGWEHQLRVHRRGTVRGSGAEAGLAVHPHRTRVETQPGEMPHRPHVAGAHMCVHIFMC